MTELEIELLAHFVCVTGIDGVRLAVQNMEYYRSKQEAINEHWLRLRNSKRSHEALEKEVAAAIQAIQDDCKHPLLKTQANTADARTEDICRICGAIL